MPPLYSDIAMLSLFYWGLSVLMLRVVISREKRNVVYLLSSLYLALCSVLGWYVQMKWLLAGSLIFMVVSMSITAWIIFKESRQCFNALKEKENTDGN